MKQIRKIIKQGLATIMLLCTPHMFAADAPYNQAATQKLIQGLRKNRPNLIKEAINEGADINYYQFNPLMQAIYSNNMDLIIFLINHGADINAQNVMGETPSQAARRLLNLNLADLKSEKAEIESE